MKVFKCDVANGWCEALDLDGDCGHYSDGICHTWMEDDVRIRIKDCEHRNRINRLSKAFKSKNKDLNIQWKLELNVKR